MTTPRKYLTSQSHDRMLPKDHRVATREPLHGVRPPSTRQLAWFLLRDPEGLNQAEQATVTELQDRSTAIAAAYPLIQEFLRIVRDRDAAAYPAWRSSVVEQHIAEIESFANGLDRDHAAVVAALTMEWSNGQTEGQVNRLKMLKRQMYGRADFDLLRKRVLHAA